MVWQAMDVDKAKEVLFEIKEILDKHNIPFWLGLGTLLGAIREKKFVEGDSDIDLSTWDSNSQKVLDSLSDFYEKGFDVYADLSGVGLNKGDIHTSVDFVHRDEYTKFALQSWAFFFSKNAITRTLFYLILHSPLTFKYNCSHTEKIISTKEKFVDTVNKILTYLPFKKLVFKTVYQVFKLAGGVYVRVTIPLDYILPLKTVNFLGKDFLVPNQSESCLAYFYGDDWRIPKKFFNLTPDSKYPYVKFKGTYNVCLVYCPKCKRPIRMNNPHKKDDGKPPIFLTPIKCNHCGYEWNEKFFVTGPIEKTFVIDYPLRQMPDRQQAFEDLKMFNQFCKRHNIFFWLDGGTLLGAVRDGTFIPWEGDIDLATKKENLDIIYQNRVEFEQLGYKIFPKQQGYAIIGKNLSSKLDIFSYTFDDEFAHLYDVERNAIGNLSEFLIFVFNQYDADYKYETTVSVNITKRLTKSISYLPIFIRKKILAFLEKLYWSFGVTRTITFNTPKEFFSKFKEIKFYDDVFNVPYETEKYLIKWYGTDWRTPKIFSNSKKDSLYKWKAHNVELK